MGSKMIYRAFSFFGFAWTLFLRLACVVALVYALAHYNENPVVIIVFACICVFCIFFIGDDQVTVYADRIVHSSNSLLSLILNSKGRTIYLAEIKKAYLQPATDPSAFETGVIAVLATVASNRRSSNRSKPIYLKMVSGETKQLDTYLDVDQMQRIVDEINLLVKPK